MLRILHVCHGFQLRSRQSVITISHVWCLNYFIHSLFQDFSWYISLSIYLILSNLISSNLIKSNLISSYLIVSYLILYYLILSYNLSIYLSYHILSHLFLSIYRSIYLSIYLSNMFFHPIFFRLQSLQSCYPLVLNHDWLSSPRPPLIRASVSGCAIPGIPRRFKPGGSRDWLVASKKKIVLLKKCGNIAMEKHQQYKGPAVTAYQLSSGISRRNMDHLPKTWSCHTS